MEHSPASSFEGEKRAPNLGEAVSIARRSVAGMIDLPIDSVAHVEKQPDGTWRIFIDLIESTARMGDNDLLATFELHIDVTGEMTFCTRQRRYRREEKEG